MSTIRPFLLLETKDSEAVGLLVYNELGGSFSSSPARIRWSNLTFFVFQMETTNYMVWDDAVYLRVNPVP